MNSILSRPVACPLAVTFGLTVLIMPIALLQHGQLGLTILGAAATTVAAIVLLTVLAQSLFREFNAHPLKRLALVSAMRMGLSLAAVIAVSLLARQFAEPAVLLYAVPFYLGLLAAESAVMVAQVRTMSRG